jgi:hypothetical protein
MLIVSDLYTWTPWKQTNRNSLDTAKRVDIASWISVAILPLCVFLLVSYAVLPVKWTNRHYLSICFTLGICCMEVSRNLNPIEKKAKRSLTNSLPYRSHSLSPLEPNPTNAIMPSRLMICTPTSPVPSPARFSSSADGSS